MSDDTTALILREIARIGSDLQAGIGRVETRLGQVETRLGQIETQQERVEGRLDELERGQSQLRVELTRVRTDVMDRIDRLQDRMEIVRDDMSVSLHSDDRVERLARSASEEARSVGSLVTAMQRQILHLQSEVRALRGGV